MILTKDNFSLDVNPVLIKPTDEDFNNPQAEGLAVHFGADFHMSYSGKFSNNPRLGILQFARSTQISGNPVMDKASGIYLDKNRIDGNPKLVDYLFGSPERKITYENSIYDGKPTSIREINRCEIYDCPREIHGLTDKKLDSGELKIKFWNFIAEIDEVSGFVIIHPYGVKWKIALTQEDGKNEYVFAPIEIKDAKINDINYKVIFNDIVHDSYKIADF